MLTYNTQSAVLFQKASGRFQRTWQHKLAEIWFDKNSTITYNAESSATKCIKWHEENTYYIFTKTNKQNFYVYLGQWWKPCSDINMTDFYILYILNVFSDDWVFVYLETVKWSASVIVTVCFTYCWSVHLKKILDLRCLI